jgi:hypothetical protein
MKSCFFALSLFALCLCPACNHLTVAPPPVVASAVAFDENAQNAGMIDCNRGCLVTPGWIARYHALEKKFEPSMPFAADAQIKPEGQNYRVSYEVSDHFADLKRQARNAP